MSSENGKFDKRKYDYQYTKDHYKRIALNLHNAEYDQLQAHIISRNENITANVLSSPRWSVILKNKGSSSGVSLCSAAIFKE